MQILPTPDESTNKKRTAAQQLTAKTNVKKEQRIERTKLLNLAMDWDCINVTKEFVFENSLEDIQVIMFISLVFKFIYIFYQNPRFAFTRALKDNLPAFAYEFLKLGYDPTDLLLSKELGPNQSQYGLFIAEFYGGDVAVRIFI